jgi:hypothetical protein
LFNLLAFEVQNMANLTLVFEAVRNKNFNQQHEHQKEFDSSIQNHT